MPATTDKVIQSVTLFDDRPFFEKALQYGIQHGVLSSEKLDALCQEAPKGMVQIARYFGTEYLRPDLERAKDRFVNLISLYLEESTGADLLEAAQALRDHTLLSRSKGGSDMLKALIALPQCTHFGMHERTGFQEAHIPLLAKWSLRTLPEYQAEQARRSQTALMVEAAIWMANRLDLHTRELEDSGKDAESVIRTALLAHACRVTKMPDWVALEKMVLGLRKKPPPSSPGAAANDLISIPKDLPVQFGDAVKSVRASMVVDLTKILDPSIGVRKLFQQTASFLGRYYWGEDALAEVDHFERANGAVWDKSTGGHSDDSSLLTLFLRIASSSSHTTLLTEKSAASLVKKIRVSGLNPELPRQFIQQFAPDQLQGDYMQLWDAFIEDAEPVLRSDLPQARQDALALLRRECNIA